MGFNFKDVLKAGAAVIAFPIVANNLRRFLPASLTGTAIGRWGVQAGSAVLVGMIAGKVLGPEARRLALVALGANLVADAVTEFFPSIASMGVAGYVGLGQYSDFQAPGAYRTRATAGLLRGSTFPGVYNGMANAFTSDPLAPGL